MKLIFLHDFQTNSMCFAVPTNYALDQNCIIVAIAKKKYQKHYFFNISEGITILWQSNVESIPTEPCRIEKFKFNSSSSENDKSG